MGLLQRPRSHQRLPLLICVPLCRPLRRKAAGGLQSSDILFSLVFAPVDVGGDVTVGICLRIFGTSVRFWTIRVAWM